MIIYKITNKINNKSYVGKTKNLEKRLYQHYHNKKSLISIALRKYGKENFDICILEEVNSSLVDMREQFWIAKILPEYNLTLGGEGGDTSKSPRYIESMKRRKFWGENNPMYGKRGHMNPNTGKIRTVEQVQQLKQALKAAWDNNPARKQQLSENKLGSNNHMYGKTPANAKKIVFENNTYSSIAAAVRTTGRSFNYVKKHGKCDDKES